ncbi:MAG: hypothetical protein AAGC81_15315 [Pseudomonadota bacterium]
MTDAAIAPVQEIDYPRDEIKEESPKKRVNLPADPKTWTISKKIAMLVRWKIGTAILRAFGINGL